MTTGVMFFSASTLFYFMKREGWEGPRGLGTGVWLKGKKKKVTDESKRPTAPTTI